MLQHRRNLLLLIRASALYKLEQLWWIVRSPAWLVLVIFCTLLGVVTYFLCEYEFERENSMCIIKNSWRLLWPPLCARQQL